MLVEDKTAIIYGGGGAIGGAAARVLAREGSRLLEKMLKQKLKR